MSSVTSGTCFSAQYEGTAQRCHCYLRVVRRGLVMQYPLPGSFVAVAFFIGRAVCRQTLCSCTAGGQRPTAKERQWSRSEIESSC